VYAFTINSVAWSKPWSMNTHKYTYTCDTNASVFRTNKVTMTKRTMLQASSSVDQDSSKSTTTKATETEITKDEQNLEIEIKEENNNNILDDFDTILQTRRTINSFLSDLPNNWEETLEKAILSAIYAPNHKRSEPWHFHLLGPEAIQNVCRLNASIVAEKKGEQAGEKKLKRWLQMPGWVVVTCRTVDKEGDGTMDDAMSLKREDYAACCCAVQNLCLSLHNAGMGTKWTTGPVNFDHRFREIIGLNEDEYVVGTIWFGTPEKIPETPAKKRSMDNVLIKHD